MTEKLVRSDIPEIIRSQTGFPASYRIADENEMPDLLLRKLQEEVSELGIAIDEGSPEDIVMELADVTEVLKAYGVTEESKSSVVDAVRKEKLFDRGGFEKRIVMDFS